MSGFQGIIGLAFTLFFCSFCMSDWKDGFRVRELLTNLSLQTVAIAVLLAVYGLLTSCNIALGRAP